MFHGKNIFSNYINRSQHLDTSGKEMAIVKNKNEWVITNLEKASLLGLEVCVDGKEYTYSEIREKKNIIIKESADYMSDYVYDEHGKVIGINFNKI